MDFTEAYDDTSSSVGLAARLGDTPLLQELLKKGYPANGHDNRGWQPLHEAAYNGHAECVSLLTASESVEVDALTHEGTTPLQLACCQGTRHTVVVKLLIKAGADPNMRKGDDWVLPLPKAITCNNIDIVKELLDAGADVNREDHHSGLPLHVATDQGLKDITELLLENKADINMCDTSGRNALHVLMFSQSHDDEIQPMLTLLLQKGIDVNVQMNDGTTPLMLAVQRRWKLTVEKLLDNSADVNIAKTDGVLALHFGIEFCSDEASKPSEENLCEESLAAVSTEQLCIMKKILDLTDNTLIIPKSAEAIKYSLYHLAVEWDKFNCLKLLLEANIPPDAFLQETSNAVLDEADVPLVLPLEISVDTPLGFLLSKPFTRERIDTAKLMIHKGCSVNAVNKNTLPPLVAVVKHQRAVYSNDDLGCEILEFLMDHGSNIMYKIRDCDILPVALYVASLFNVAALFKILQHGVPVSRVFTHAALQALSLHYRSSSFYTIYPLFPWRVISWLHTVNLFLPQFSLDTDMLFDQHRMVDDENLSNAWKNFSRTIGSPKSLQQLCVLAVREAVGTAKGWPQLMRFLKQLEFMNAPLPPIIMDLLLFTQVQSDGLFRCPPQNAMLSYLAPESPPDSEVEENSYVEDVNAEEEDITSIENEGESDDGSEGNSDDTEMKSLKDESMEHGQDLEDSYCNDEKEAGHDGHATVEEESSEGKTEPCDATSMNIFKA
ncbi:ankyrin-3-like isoform X2 [Penaeus chinensis]|uniref:ankyrin-3-like isoform X2 n=1 Tax=Penaeus chinensis TaxID=139456 RepID=UPI001FB707AB|nr:ankyrin-3-like isoform X2 [Penaeus chinensis]